MMKLNPQYIKPLPGAPKNRMMHTSTMSVRLAQEWFPLLWDELMSEFADRKGPFKARYFLMYELDYDKWVVQPFLRYLINQRDTRFRIERLGRGWYMWPKKVKVSVRYF